MVYASMYIFVELHRWEWERGRVSNQGQGERAGKKE